MHTLQEDFITHDANFAQSLTLMNQKCQEINDKISEVIKNQLTLNASQVKLKVHKKEVPCFLIK
jgi:2C-methyl-D-erythritol 2,4-cyclodiphosphate synthase